MSSSLLTDLDIARAFVCPHWPYWDRFGDHLLKHTGDEAAAEDLFEVLWNERTIISQLAPQAVFVTATTPQDAAKQTEQLMRDGVSAIAHPTLLTEELLGNPTLLLRKDGSSRLGDYLYVPLDIRRGIHLRKDEAFRLFFYGDLLAAIQGASPTSYTFANRDGVCFEASIDVLGEEYRDFITRLKQTITGTCPDPVYRKGCQDTSPWGRACFELAQSRDDLALLFSVSQKQMTGLRSQGIETVHQAADMDPAQLDGTAPGLTLRSLVRLQRQARSLVDRSVIVRAAWPQTPSHTHVFFDIESHPGTDEDYLYGFLIKNGDEAETVHSLNTFTSGSEAELWQTFLAFIRTLPADYRVYHYGDYEYTRLTTLAQRYHTIDPLLAQFMERMIDVKELVRDCLVLPLFFYSIKAVASFLGYHWHEDIRHGRDSVRIYEQWLQTKDQTLASMLTTYNEDDVRGLAHAVSWAEIYANTETAFVPPYPWSAPSDTLNAI